jgi:hypothetical protein
MTCRLLTFTPSARHRRVLLSPQEAELLAVLRQANDPHHLIETLLGLIEAIREEAAEQAGGVQ